MAGDDQNQSPPAAAADPAPVAADDVDLLFVSDKYISPGELAGRDFVVQIGRVQRGVVTGEGGRKATKGLLSLDGWTKPLVLNKTNARFIKAMYGRRTKGWIGKTITIYPTTTTVGDEKDRPCIRVRPDKPSSPPTAPPPTSAPTQQRGPQQGGQSNAPR